MAAPGARSTVRVMRLRSALGGYVVDLLVGVVLVISLLEVWLEDEIHGSPWALTLFALAWTLPLFARRRFPVAAPAATLILLGVQVAIWDHSVPYSFGAYMMALIATSQFGLLGLTVQGLAGAALTALVIAFVGAAQPRGRRGRRRLRQRDRGDRLADRLRLLRAQPPHRAS